MQRFLYDASDEDHLQSDLSNFGSIAPVEMKENPVRRSRDQKLMGQRVRETKQGKKLNSKLK